MRLPPLVALCALTACFEQAPDIGAGSTDATGADGSGGEPGPVVTVRGRLTSSIGLAMALPGIKIVLVGDDEVETLTDAEGAFELVGVPAGGARFIASTPTPEYIGSIIGLDVPFVDVEGVSLPRLSRLDVQGIVDRLTLQDASLEYDSAAGALLVTSTRGDTDITLDPMPTPGTYYALDAQGNPVLGANASQYFVPSVVYFNLPPAPSGELRVTASHPTYSCVVPLADPPVIGDHVSWLQADCQ